MKTKEVAFRPNTSDHDLGHKVKKVREFLDAGDRVKLIVKFRGREMVHQNLGSLVLQRLLAYCPGAVSSDIKLEGRTASMILAPPRR